MTGQEESDPGAAVWERERRRRAEGKEAIWVAQIILWLPLLTSAIAVGFMLFGVFFGGAEVHGVWPASVLGGLASLLFPALYGLAGWWIGARQDRGVWLGIALFGWSLATSVLHGHFVTYRMGYAVLGLALVVRAGRALGIPQLSS